MDLVDIMERDTAYSYVLYGMRATKFSPKTGRSVLFISLIIAGISLLLYHTIAFIIANVIYAVVHIVMTMVFEVKWNSRIGFVSQGIHLLLFDMSLNLLDFSLEKMSVTFELRDFLVAIGIQFVAISLGVIFALYTVKKHRKDKKPKVSDKIAASSAIMGCFVGRAAYKIFFANVTKNLFYASISVLLNLVICLVLFVVPMAFYRAYLIKKFTLVLEPSIDIPKKY